MTLKKLAASALFVLLMLATLAGAFPVAAQSPVSISSMSVALWPEYDKPGILVIYTGRLATDVKLPVRLTFAIPLSTGGPSSTAGIDAQGQYRYQKYDAVTQGEQILVSYDCPYSAFQFEYYWDPLAGQSADRKIDYTYRADYAIEALSLEVQQPAAASDLKLSPAATETKTGGDGLTLQSLSLGKLAAGQTTTVAITYRNPEQKLSATVLGLPTPGSVPFENVPQTTSQGASGSGLPPSTIAIIVIVVVTIIAIATVLGLYIWVNAKKAAPVVPQPQMRKKGKKAQANAQRQAADPATAPRATGSTYFCHQCGRALKADEQFCPACGTRRKGS